MCVAICKITGMLKRADTVEQTQDQSPNTLVIREQLNHVIELQLNLAFEEDFHI